MARTNENDAAVKAAEEVKAKEEVKVTDKVTVNLYYDGDTYVDPVIVGYNGKQYSVPRGVDVEVPRGVAEIIRHSEEQDRKTKQMINRIKQKPSDE